MMGLVIVGALILIAVSGAFLYKVFGGMWKDATKPYEELNDEEKKARIYEYVRHGELTMQQADVLIAKIDGTKSATQIAMETGAGADLIKDSNNVNSMKKDDGTGKIVKGAVVGGVVAGPAGAVVGAVVGKNKADNDKK